MYDITKSIAQPHETSSASHFSGGRVPTALQRFPFPHRKWSPLASFQTRPFWRWSTLGGIIRHPKMYSQYAGDISDIYLYIYIWFMMYILYELWDVWVDSTSGDQKWPNVRGAQDGCWKFHFVWYEESQGARVWCLRMDSTLFTQASVSSWQFRSLRSESWKQILRSFETRIAWTRHTPANTRTGAKKLFTKWYQENTPVPCIQSSKIALNHWTH